jgi:hypothetical protein
MASKKKTVKAVKKVAVKRALPKGYVAATDIGRSMGLDGKTTRRILRSDGSIKIHKDYGWAVPSTKRRTVVNILEKRRGKGRRTKS